MSFFTDLNNLALAGVAAVSGALLAWPTLSARLSGGSNVNASEATRLINRSNALVIDVRSPQEFAGGHLPGARNLPLDTLSDKIGSLGQNRETPVVVVCQSGMRSARAVSVLRKQGWAAAVNLEGGLAAWQQAGLPLIK